MPKLVHAVAGAIALATISLFWLSTVAVELSGWQAGIMGVKTTIPYGFIVLIPALIATGGSGGFLARGRGGRLVDTKRIRMKIVAANGLLLLVPAALFLSVKASQNDFDSVFALVQIVELAAGAANILLLSRNMRDGLRLSGRGRSGARRRLA